MKIKNNGTTSVLIGDLIHAGYPVELEPAEEITVLSEDS